MKQSLFTKVSSWKKLLVVSSIGIGLGWWSYNWYYKPALSEARLASRSRIEELYPSIWQKFVQHEQPSRSALIDAYSADCKKLEYLNANIPTHEQNNERCRIVTYNVHSWRDPNHDRNFDAIIENLSTMNADVIILQEVSLFDQQQINKRFADLGYCSQQFGKAATYGVSFGNMILSKYPFARKPVVKTFAAEDKNAKEKRCYIKAQLALPSNKQLTIYGTHLDVYDETENLRMAELKELLDDAQQERGMVFIGGDFNAVREQDYQMKIAGHTVWDLLNQNQQKRIGMPLQTKALKQIGAYGFTDSFSCADQHKPAFTVWSGKLVDFIFLKKENAGQIVGAYPYYSAASDHMPIITDFRLQ